MPIALGTDTTGGVRIPAACCGVVGYRPSVNRWSSGDYGVRLTYTMDTVGIISNTIRDVRFVDELVTGEKHVDVLKPEEFRIGVPN